MSEAIIGFISLIVGLIGGYGINKYLLSKSNASLQEAATAQAEAILKEAELEGQKIKQSRIAKANEKYQQLKNRFEKEAKLRKEKLGERDKRIKQRENSLNQRTESLKQKNESLRQKHEALKKEQIRLKKEQKEVSGLQGELEKELQGLQARQEELEAQKDLQIQELEKIATMTAEDAKEMLVNMMKQEAQTKATAYIKDIVAEAQLTATKKSKKIIIETIQRTAAEHAIENTVTVFPLENDEIKGRIIGREGRNIRALEMATGVEIIVDDTPEAIILSGFDPVRREIARLALHKLVTDGRIHPARIEEVVKKTTKRITEEIMETGERTVIDLGIHGLHAELIRMVGRMKYRSSYGQNLLQHSREVALLCATMAAELGLNTKLAKRAGLLHDIGKVAEDHSELPHALLGMKMAEKFKEHPEVCNAIGAHHDEIEMTSLLSPIIQACDAISGSRPGARREIVESYIKRLKELESLGQSYPGVMKTYAIQAGRELRVIVESEKVSDDQADQLAFDISQRIQSNMQYPGHIKVTVIREKRAIAYAK